MSMWISGDMPLPWYRKPKPHDKKLCTQVDERLSGRVVSDICQSFGWLSIALSHSVALMVKENLTQDARNPILEEIAALP